MKKQVIFLYFEALLHFFPHRAEVRLERELDVLETFFTDDDLVVMAALRRAPEDGEQSGRVDYSLSNLTDILDKESLE